MLVSFNFIRRPFIYLLLLPRHFAPQSRTHRLAILKRFDCIGDALFRIILAVSVAQSSFGSRLNFDPMLQTPLLLLLLQANLSALIRGCFHFASAIKARDLHLSDCISKHYKAHRSLSFNDRRLTTHKLLNSISSAH
jgi:hypothetical protein